MQKRVHDGVKLVCNSITEGFFHGKTLLSMRTRALGAISRIAWLDDRSRSMMRSLAEDTIRRAVVQKDENYPMFIGREAQEWMKAFNRAFRRTWVETKKTHLGSSMKMKRDMDDPVVFYLVSSHQKPQKAHEPLQGKLLVDNRWKSVLLMAGKLEEAKEVERFLRKKKVLSVQAALKEPYYLIVRPNCRHYLIPVKTGAALRLTEKQLKEKSQPKVTHIHRPITDKQRYAEWLELKRMVMGYAMRKLMWKRGAVLGV